MGDKLLPLEEAAWLVNDGSVIAFGGSLLRRKPMAFVRALIRRRARDLQIVSCLASMDFDLLIGSGATSVTHAVYVGFEQLGMAPNFVRRDREGTLQVNEYSEYMMMRGLKAANMGLPYLPTRAGLGSDLVELRKLKVVECPYSGDPLLAVPAVRPDLAVIHAMRADPYGNVQTARARDFSSTDLALARAAKRVIVTVEEVVSPKEFLSRAAATALFEWEVDAVVEAPRGAWPTSYSPLYEADVEHCAYYLELAQTVRGFQQYLEEHVLRADQPVMLGAPGGGA